MPVRSLQYVAMCVPDLEVGRRFYTDFGLEAEERGDNLILRCQGREQDQLRLLEGSPKQLHHVCFGTREDELPQLQTALENSGARKPWRLDVLALRNLWRYKSPVHFLAQNHHSVAFLAPGYPKIG